MVKHIKIGEILLKEGLITEEQLKEAIEHQAKEGGKLGEILIKLGYITEEQIIIVLSKQLSIPYATLGSGGLEPAADQNLKELIPYEFAIRNLVLPIARNLNSLTIALYDPLDLILIDNLKKLTGCEINPIITSRQDILKAIEKYYGRERMLRTAIEATYREETPEETDSEDALSLDKLIAKSEEAPVVKLVDLIIKQAIEDNASDIHIEPQRDKLSLRYRIDGVLYEVPPPSKSLQLPLISRIKILSKMNIAEKRLPQDGGFTVRTENKLVDLRTATIPTIYGEKVVIRILDRSRVPLELEKLGFSPQELRLIRKGIAFPYGLILLTGPTGSGKSTTLYAVLNELNSPKKNIITIEDPVEYRLDGINQVQVKPEIGLTFANVLRSFLRQDPDIIMVGETRDLETAEICVRAALTGHTVFSSLHTNNSVVAITRLIDMGIPPYLLASALRLVVAQRLPRKLCPACKEPYEAKKERLPPEVELGPAVIYKPKGCKECNYIGFKGRTAIGEILLLDEELQEAVYKRVFSSEIMKLARGKGTQTLLESGLRKVREGITSLEEVLSITTF